MRVDTIYGSELDDIDKSLQMRHPVIKQKSLYSSVCEFICLDICMYLITSTYLYITLLRLSLSLSPKTKIKELRNVRLFLSIGHHFITIVKIISGIL